MPAQKKKTLVVGASENPSRYSNLAIDMLIEYNHDVVALGQRAGFVHGIAVQTGMPEIHHIDTVTLYINPVIQKAYYDYIVKLNPNRVVFNPGTENEEFEMLLQNAQIEVEEACTLVMLRSGTF